MARRRKVNNLLALAVLSTVQQRPMHRYEMASIMRARGKERDMQIKWGSLYTVVENLEKHGFLETIGSSRDGARPERTVYRITQAGRDEMVDWTRELIAELQPESPRFAAGLSVLTALAPSEAIELLRARLETVEETVRAERAEFARNSLEIPRLFLVENEYSVAILDAEATWIRSLLDELESGTHPSLAAWQSWHETGEMPDDFAELAERGSTPERP